MINSSILNISGQQVTKVEITDIDELKRRIGKSLDIANHVDGQAMDMPAMRGQTQISSDVAMGLIGHAVICEILTQNSIECELHFEEDGFYLMANTTKIKARTSFGKFPPCPKKQIDKFTITGGEVGSTNICDYYIQVIFCDSFNLDDTSSNIILYIVGGLHKSKLTNTAIYEKQTVTCGTIAGSDSLQNIMTKL